MSQKKAQQNTVVGETARITQDIQTSCHQEHFRFSKPGNVEEPMTQWEKDRENVKTEKAKKWVHASCGREGFPIKNIIKDTPIILLEVVVQLKKILIHYWLH